MNWNEKVKEKEVIEKCRQSQYEDYGHDYEEDVQDELYDGDDWGYWASRMKADLEKEGVRNDNIK